MSSKVYTTGQVADICGVNFRTVIRWIKCGKLKSYTLPGRGDNRVTHENLINFLDENNMPLDIIYSNTDKETTKNTDKNTILIIDDDINLSNSLERVINHNEKLTSFKTKIITNSLEAGHYLAKVTPIIILLDINMPGLSGFDILEFLKEQNIKTNVIVISAMPEDDLEKCLELGAITYFTKPFKSQLIIDYIINEVLKL